MDQLVQQMAVVQQEYVNAWNTVTQLVRYAQEQWDVVHGITAAALNPAPQTTVPQTGSAPSSSTAVAHEAAPATTSTTKPKAQVSDSPLVPVSGFLWDPTHGTNASNGLNWDYNGQEQNDPNTALVPGQTADPVVFDPATTVHLHGAGNSPIVWDYSPKIPFFMQVGTTSLSSYGQQQTINTGVTIQTTGVNTTSASSLNLDFLAASSTFQINGDSTITNMTLAGQDRSALFAINSGTTTIAQSPGYSESIGVQVTIAPGATLNDQSYNTLSFTNNNLVITVFGTMRTYYGSGAGTTLIDSGAYSGDYIDVENGTLSYAGSGNVSDTFNAPVYVNSGSFLLSTAVGQPNGATLTVKGAVPGKAPNASVYLAGTGTVQLSQAVTLVCDNAYYQASGTLETTDATQCTLENKNGTATVNGGTVWVDNQQNSYGRLNLTGNLSLNAQLSVSVLGYTPNGNAGTSDQLYVSGTLTLNKATSTILVYDYGTLQKGAQNTDFWNVIVSPNNIVNDFLSGSASPAANLSYGPSNVPDPGYYAVTFNG